MSDSSTQRWGSDDRASIARRQVAAKWIAACALLICTMVLNINTARADALDDVLQVLSTAGVIDPAVVEAKPMIQCLINGGVVDQCASYAADKAQGLVPNDPKIQKVVGVFHAVQAQDWLKVFLLAGEQVVCSLVPGGAIKDLFCGEIFAVAKPVITSAYGAVRDGDILKLVSILGVEYACDLLPDVSGASHLCGVLGDIVGGVAKGVTEAVGAVGSLAEDIAGQTQHMSVEDYYLTQWRGWLQYAVIKQLRTGTPAYLYAGMYGGTPCVEYFDSHKMSESSAEKVCAIMKQRFLEEVSEAVKVFQAFPSTFIAGAAAPRMPGWASAYYDAIEASAASVSKDANPPGSWIKLYYPKAPEPYQSLLKQCLSHKPVVLPKLPSANEGLSAADRENLGTAVGWACTRVSQLLALSLPQQKKKLTSVIPQVAALGCTKITPTPALHYSCPTYAAFHKCTAIYPSGDTASERFCWVDSTKADLALAQDALEQLGTKRCAIVPQPGNPAIKLQCTRPWKQTHCNSVVAAGSAGAPLPSNVKCLVVPDRMYIAGKQQAQSIIKSMNTKPTGGGYIDPKTGTTQSTAMITGAKCQAPADGLWDPLRISCQDPDARKELNAKLSACAVDSAKDGADSPCYDGPLSRQGGENQPAVAQAKVPSLPVGAHIVDVRFEYFKRVGRGWARTDAPVVGAMVAVSCVYGYSPVDAKASKWSIAFAEGPQVLDTAFGPGLVDPSSHRVTRTWYGTLLRPGSVELGCVADPEALLSEINETDNRLMRTINVPGPQRLASGTQDNRPRVGRATTRQAAEIRGGPPRIDLQFADFIGIKRANAAASSRTAPSLQTAALGEPLIIDCTYLVNMDAPNGEPVALSPWHASIGEQGKPSRQVLGAAKVVSVKGVSLPISLRQQWTPSTLGEYTFKCQLDVGNRTTEIDETNNEAVLTLNVSTSSSKRRH